MLSKEEIKKWLLENCVNENGDLNLSCLDFSDFDGDVDISNLKVKHDLSQCGQNVQGNLLQYSQEVQGSLFQYSQEVQGSLYQGFQNVQGKIYND